MFKKLAVLAVILLSGALLIGLFRKDDDKVEEENFENVTIVGEEDDKVDDTGDKVDENDDPVLDEPDDEGSDADNTVVDMPAEDTVTTDPVEEEQIVTDAGELTIGTASSADGASVVGYSYEVAGGKFMFEWKVRASEDKPYPMIKVYQLEDGTLMAEYGDLVKDYVAKEETVTDLGNQLPELTWMPTDSGSSYKFAFTSEKSFELKTDDRGEDGLWIILEVTL
ncbi:hypothetical protein KC685_02265 [Candidatus Dojkabacteria bacterium]|uniref:Uncharacterized protein n=1 Tax=Candidatus Dojkabacteria bacterium TaxID=2099670 RepID=A0A955I922_9BACT|nr:hypothetical protein [Candidatus Dojkabacteria bacterium]